jgi:outer membrane biosynthesis protein TonB
MTEILEIYKLPELEDKLNESKDNTLLIFLPKEFGHEFSTNFTISSSFIQPPAPKPKPEPPKPKPEPPKPKAKPEPPKPKVAKPKKPKEVEKAIEDLDTLDFNF